MPLLSHFASDLLPKDIKIYNINLNTREIEAPKFLSVETDHASTIIYFRVAKFFDLQDLTQTNCVIEYYNVGAQNPNFKSKNVASGIYSFQVPSYWDDPENLNYMIIPWYVALPATITAGDICFSVKFYLLANEEDNYDYTFVLNTKKASSVIQEGIGQSLKRVNNYTYSTSTLEKMYDQLIQTMKEIKEQGISSQSETGSSVSEKKIKDLIAEISNLDIKLKEANDKIQNNTSLITEIQNKITFIFSEEDYNKIMQEYNQLNNEITKINKVLSSSESSIGLKDIEWIDAS